MSLRPGLEYRFALFAAFFLIIAAVTIMVKRRGKMPFLRRIAGIDSLEELVGRAAEMGRPIMVTFGIQGRMSSGSGSEGTVAGLAVLGYIARLCARAGAHLVAVMQDEAVVPLALQNMYQGYLAEGKPEMMRTEDVEYLPQYSYTVGVVESMERHQIASFVQVGMLTHEAVIMTESAAKVGAMQLGGHSQLFGDLGLMMAFSDYQLVADELLAAGAFVSKNVNQAGSIVGSDYCKFLIIALAVIAVVLTNIGVKLPKF